MDKNYTMERFFFSIAESGGNIPLFFYPIGTERQIMSLGPLSWTMIPTNSIIEIGRRSNKEKRIPNRILIEITLSRLVSFCYAQGSRRITKG